MSQGVGRGGGWPERKKKSKDPHVFFGRIAKMMLRSVGRKILGRDFASKRKLDNKSDLASGGWYVEITRGTCVNKCSR